MEKNKTTSEANKASDIKLTAEELATQKATLDQKEIDLNNREEALNEREKSLNNKEQMLNNREANLPVVDAKEVKVVPGVKFEFRGNDYKFTDDAPKKILFEGIAYSQKEIVKDEDIVIQLVGGNSSLIQKL